MQVYNVLKNCKIKGMNFNTQKVTELGGSSSKIDIQCNLTSTRDIGIEVKKSKTPDWMQFGLKYTVGNGNGSNGHWQVTEGNKHPDEAKELMNKILKNKKIFNNKEPPFVKKKITHKEWLLLKNGTNIWRDNYIDVPGDTIKRLYALKSCNYIQLSDGYGLYHLGDDKCNFGVPLFDVEQQLRIRTKVHKRVNKDGFCTLSVTASCKPKDIKLIKKSPYSLDDKNKLPLNLRYN